MNSDNSQQDKARQERAGALLDKAKALRAKEGFMPLVVEFAGSPKSGKSTNIDIVTHFFKRVGFRVWSPTEGASKRTPFQLRRNLVAFNTWALNYAINEILLSCQHPEPYDLVILDRGVFDSLAWMRLLRDREELTDGEYRAIESFALHPKWADTVGRICLFTCAPQTSMSREHETKLIFGEGTAMKGGMLAPLLRQYESLRDEFGDKYPIQNFSTDNGATPRETGGKIADDILSLLEKKVNDA